jgi:hypothetical protein
LFLCCDSGFDAKLKLAKASADSLSSKISVLSAQMQQVMKQLRDKQEIARQEGIPVEKSIGNIEVSLLAGEGFGGIVILFCRLRISSHRVHERTSPF